MTVAYKDALRQSQALHRFGNAINRETNSDRRFFEENPQRQCRLRKAFAAEKAQTIAMSDASIPEGLEIFVAVRQVCKGHRERAVFVTSADYQTDRSDTKAGRVFRSQFGACEAIHYNVWASIPEGFVQ